MEDMEWSVEEESNLTIGEKITNITFHSRLNTLVAVTSEFCVKIVDLQSGVTLQKSNLAECNRTSKSHPLVCEFLNKANQLFVTQGAHVGLRKEHNGILLLDSALQTTIQADSDVVLVEMPHVEVKLLLQYLKSSKTTENWKKVIDALEDGLKNSKLPNEQAYHRFTKWATVQVWLPQFDFHKVVVGVVKELMQSYQNIPELSVAAALMDRLKRLLPESVPLWLGNTNTDESRRVVNRALMFSEVARRETFDLWPHMDYKWAHPDAMAQAGFYHQPVSPGDDRALCFTCHVCLVCWEPTDEPWSEHERHSSNCPYVQGGATQNVPLSATLATAPAQRHGDGKEPITCISSVSSGPSHLMATSTKNGHICVWDVSDQLTLACNVVVKESDITNPVTQVLHAWGEKTERNGIPNGKDKDKNSDAEETENGGDKPPMVLFGNLVISDDVDPTNAQPSETPLANCINEGFLHNGNLKPDETTGLLSSKQEDNTSNLLPSSGSTTVGATAAPPEAPPKTSKSILVTSLHLCQPPKMKHEYAATSVIKDHTVLVVGVSVKQKPAKQDGGSDEAGTGMDLSQREDEFVDNLMGDEVDVSSGSVWRHYLLVYKLQSLPTSVIPSIITEIEKEKILMQSQDPLLTLNAVMKKTGGTSASSSSTPVVPDNYLDYVFLDVDESASTSPGPSYFASCVGKNKKQLECSLLQCVELPSEVQRNHLRVTNIEFCGGSNSSVVVVVSPCDMSSLSCNSLNDGSDLKKMEPVDEQARDGGALLQYGVNDKSEVSFLDEELKQIKLIPSSSERIIKLIPLSPRRKESVRSEDGDEVGHQSAISSRIDDDQYDRSSDAAEEDEPDFGSSLGSSFSVLAVLRASGSVELLNIHCFQRLASFNVKASPSGGNKFVCLAYCHGMDRLCAVTEDGRASILVVHQASEGSERAADSSRIMDSDSILIADSVDANVDSKNKEDSFIGSGNLTVDNLRCLHELTQFKTLVPRFKATVPPSWNEIHQEQQQRRHPQHLHQRNEDSSQHTRTWKLQPDGSSWKEHLIELLLTRTSIGHVDIKFNFLPSSQPPPKIQVALLTQTEKKHSVPVDAQIEFRMDSKQQQQQPPTDPMAVFANPFNEFNKGDEVDGATSQVPFLVKHQKDIVCGPCVMESFSEMPSFSGSVSLTSSELMASRDRSFLLYIGAVEEAQSPPRQDSKDPPESEELMSQLLNSHPSTGSEKISLGNQKTQVKGCDLIQKISITIRRTKKLNASLPRGDRFQRKLMLEMTEFHHKLFRIVACEEVNDLSPQGQRLALDILSWIAGVQNCEAPNKPASLISILMGYLPSLIRSCYVEGDRSIAHKCSQFLAQCLGCVKKSSQEEKELKAKLLKSLLDSMNKVAHFTSAGALDWYFRLLYLVMSLDEEAVGTTCLNLLMETSKLLDEKMLHEHVFLRASYGLYGTPLDPVLFEIQPQLPKQDPTEVVNTATNPCLLGYSSLPPYADMTPDIVSQKSSANTTTAEKESDLTSLDGTLMEDGAFSFLEGLNFMSGLLEVEPLHFSCCATSDGTQVVKDDQAAQVQPSNKAPSAAYNPLSAPSMVPKPSNTTQQQQQQQGYPPMFSMSSLTSAMASVEQQLFANMSTIKQLKQSDSQKSSQPPTPKNTPFFMTPPLSPPFETLWSPVTTSTYPEDLMSVLNGTVDNAKGEDVEVSPSHFSASSNILQNLVSPPELYSMLIERMHAGARRYAVLDFGHPVLLTDVFFPACKDLGSVTIDVWTKGENLDGRRLAVALDISSLNLVLNDLLDPPVCRYVKITVIGRYGINTARSKIPLGSYYGHSVALPSSSLPGSSSCHDSEAPLALGVIPPAHVDHFLLSIGSVLEDIHCRYSLACSQLTSLLQNIEQDFTLRGLELYLQSNIANVKTTENVKKVYSECLRLQQQLVVVQRTAMRLQASRRGGMLPRSYSLNSHKTQSLQNMSADALAVLCQHLLDTILALSDKYMTGGITTQLTLETSKALFKHICLKGTTELRSKTGSLLMKGGGMQPWWGEFLAWILTDFFSHPAMFPQERVFMLLVSLGQRSLTTKTAESLVSHILTLLASKLNPLKENPSQSSVGMFDVVFIRWTLLFLSFLLDATPLSEDSENESAKGDPWSFLSSNPQAMEASSSNTFKGNGVSAAQIQARLKKQLELHQAKLNSLKNLLKTWKSKMESKNKHWDFQFRKEIHHQASKQVRDIERLQKLTAKAKVTSDKKTDALERISEQKPPRNVKLPRNPSLQVTRGLFQYLLAMDFTCHVDIFMITCKVLAKIASSTVPCITLAEIATEDQLLQLLDSCLGSSNPTLQGMPRGPWAFHSVSCLLSDILEGEISIQAGVDQEEGAVGGQVDDIPSLEKETIAEPGMDVELTGDADANEENVFPEVIEPVVPTPLPIDPSDFIASGGNDYLPGTIPTFPDQDFMFGSTKHSASPNIAYQMAPPYSTAYLKHSWMGKVPGKQSKQLTDLKKVDPSDKHGIVMPRVSSGMDARLEVGLDMGAEWFLRIHQLHQALVIAQTFVSESCDEISSDALLDDGERALEQEQEDATEAVVSSSELLQQCFQKVFSGLSVGSYSVENSLKMWLQLTTMADAGQPMDMVFSTSGSPPRISMSPVACKSILNAILTSGHIPSIVWCLLFHALTLVLNQTVTGDSTDALIADSNLHHILIKFLSQGGSLDVFGSANQSQVGPSITEAFWNFLSSLLLKSPVSISQRLLKLIKVLVEPGGAIHCSFGPVDAQVKLLNFVVDKDVLPLDSDIVLTIAKHVSRLLQCHFASPSRLAIQSVGESSLNSKLVELIDKTPKAKAGQNIILSCEGNRDMLLGLLLQFISKQLTFELDLPSAKSLEEKMERIHHHHHQGTSLTDSYKLGTHHQSYSTDSISDDDKERSGELMHQLAAASSNQQKSASFSIVDLILSSQETMSNFLYGLSQAASGDTLGAVTSVSSQLYHLLMTISREALSEKMVARSIVTYLKDQKGSSHHISEPLLWFLRSALNDFQAFSTFCEYGGIEILCSNLVQSSQVSIESSMDLVSATLRSMEKRKSNAKPPAKKTQDTKKQFGLVNFAPYCTVTSASLNTTHPESLLHHTTSVRRSRTAWSYHFYPNETWYDMAVNLPCAVLLEEVHINLSSTSVGRCPSGIVLEVSSDGFIFAPVCSPITISSLVTIRLCLSRPEVVQAIIIRLKKPVDSSVMNLSGIKVLGRPVFDRGSTKSGQAPLDSVQVCVRWLRLLQHCLTISPLQELPQNLMSVTAQAPGLLATCSALLTIPQGYPHRGDIESILLRLGLSSSEVGLTILDMLLRNCFPAPYQGVPSGLVTRLRCRPSLSGVDLIAQLGLTPDSGTKDRVQALLDWLGDTARVALHSHSNLSRGPVTLSTSEYGLLRPAATHVHCVACVIWATHTQGAKIDLSGVLTKELFSSVYEWSMVLPVNSPLKRAVDYVLSAMCQVQTAFYDSLLLWMGIQRLSNTSGPLTDDNKEDELTHLTDDSKGAIYLGLDDGGAQGPDNWGHLVIDEVHLTTLALASQSPEAVERLINSGFLMRLADSLSDFCNHEILRREMPQLGNSLTDSSKAKVRLVDTARSSPRSPIGNDVESDSFTLTADLVKPVLNFFTELCNEPSVKNWLGSPEGSVFWSPLLTVLCHFNRLSLLLDISSPSHRRGPVLTISQYGDIENAALDFFAKCIVCHSSNQKLLAQNICDELCGQEESTSSKKCLSGFLRRLILRLMLEDERISLALSSSCYLQRQNAAADIQQISHPMYGVGKKNMVLDVRLNSKSEELISMVTESVKSDQEDEKSGEKSETTSPYSHIGPDDKKSESSSPYVMVHIGPDKKSIFETELTEIYSGSGLPKKHDSKKTGDTKKKSSKTRKNVKEKSTSSLSSSSSSSQTVQLACPTLGLSHPYLRGLQIPGEMTLGQIVTALRDHGMEEGFSTIQFGVIFQSQKTSTSKTDSSKSLQAQENGHSSLGESSAQETLIDTPTIPSFLQVFASLGGLALLAEHLPHAYHQMAFDQSSWQSLNKEYNTSLSERKIQEDLFGDDPKDDAIFDNTPLSLTTTSKKETHAVQPMLTTPSGPANIPPHSLAAFGIFLRLPGYAEVLLKEQTKARYLLRLMLGVNEDKDGNNILSMPEASWLPTLPFTALIGLLNNTLLATDDGVVLRKMCLETGSIHLILACLAVLSHQSPATKGAGEANPFSELKAGKGPTATSLGVEAGLKDHKAQSYWAKGTGFGTGSTVSGWNAEEALKRQRAEEEHVTCLFRVLSGYIYPHDWDNETAFLDVTPDLSEDQQQSIFPAVLLELLKQSCLLPAISSYLRNDSVLDMAQHVPLYCSVLEILRALAVNSNLSTLLIHQDDPPTNTSDVTLLNLLETMKNCVDVYNSKLGNGSKAKKDKRKTVSSRRVKSSGKGDDDSDEKDTEGLAQLIPEINKTLQLVKTTVDRLLREKKGVTDSRDGDMSSEGAAASSAAESSQSKDGQYVSVMKKLQFDTFEMITEDADGKIKFNLCHHFASRVQSAGNIKNAGRARRLAQEAVTLSTSLPLSTSSTVFVRCDEDRLDVMKVLITGPCETPYSLGCFEFDVFFPSDYPKSPMLVNLETTGQHSVRFNPNLYNDGKVCLSVLNTWHGRPEERWNGDTSSFLQVLVSIQSLILVAEPYFNEPGYERSRGTVSGTKSSREYDANIMQATVKWGMLEMLRHPPACFKEVIQTHFYLKKDEVLRQCDSWIKQLTSFCNDKRVGRTVTHHLAALKRHTAHLQEELRSLQPPDSLQITTGDETSSSQAETAEPSPAGAAAAAVGDVGSTGGETANPPGGVDEAGTSSAAGAVLTASADDNEEMAISMNTGAEPPVNNDIDIGLMELPMLLDSAEDLSDDYDWDDDDDDEEDPMCL